MWKSVGVFIMFSVINNLFIHNNRVVKLQHQFSWNHNANFMFRSRYNCVKLRNYLMLFIHTYKLLCKHYVSKKVNFCKFCMKRCRRSLTIMFQGSNRKLWTFYSIKLQIFSPMKYWTIFKYFRRSQSIEQCVGRTFWSAGP